MIKREVGLKIALAENTESFKRNQLPKGVSPKWEESNTWFDETDQCIKGEWELRYVVMPFDAPHRLEFSDVTIVTLPYTEKPPSEWPSDAVITSIPYKTVSVRWSAQDETDFPVTKKIAQDIVNTLDLVAIWNKPTTDAFRISVGHKASW